MERQIDFSSKSFLWWRNWGFIWRSTIDVKVLVKSEQWSANQLRSLPEFPAPCAELNSCWDFHWTPFRSVWLLSLPSMLFELELTSAHLWALLLLIRPVLKVNTSIYKRKVPSVHQPKSKYTPPIFQSQHLKSCHPIKQKVFSDYSNKHNNIASMIINEHKPWNHYLSSWPHVVFSFV